MTFSLSHSVKFSGMIERNLRLLCFVMIFIMVASLHKPWLCVTITMRDKNHGAAPLKTLPGCRNGDGEFKACNMRNFSRRLKLTKFPVTIATR